MSGPIVRTGTNPKFWEGWDKVFANKPQPAAAPKKTAKSKAAEPAAEKAAPAKKAAAKKPAKKKA